MKLKNISWIVPIVALQSAFGAEYYRPNAQSRFFGQNQGNVGSCAAEADVAALESVFSSKNMPVRLSTHYRHVFNWKDKDLSKHNDLMIQLKEADQNLMKRAGAFVPDYMMPETGEGFGARAGVRPYISDIAIVDPEFPHLSSFGFSEGYFSFKPGYSNSSSLDRLKAEVAAGEAVVTSIHGAFLINHTNRWNPQTGLLRAPYRQAETEAAIGKKVSDQTTHAVAVVGYDDSIYRDHGYRVPGALIVRNSWNSSELIKASGYGPFSRETEDALASFRYKLHPSVNLPGYYAIPYDYFLDMAAAQMGDYKVYKLDFGRYAESYAKFESRYSVVRVPYVCESNGGFDVLMSNTARRKVQWFGDTLASLKATSDAATIQRFNKQLNDFLHSESKARWMTEGAFSLFKYALMPSNSTLGVNRAVEFYQGKFNEYYCGSPRVEGRKGTGVWPYVQHFQSSSVSQAISELSSSATSRSAWFKFINGLYKQGAYSVFE
jgi:hypothetical protein